MIELCHVHQHVGKAVADIPGEEDDVFGEVTFTPSIGFGESWQVEVDGEFVTVPAIPVECTIENGILTYDDSPGVDLFAGGTNSNPEKIVWRVAYNNVTVGGRYARLLPFHFEVVPSGEVDLALATPVSGHIPPGIVRGPRGEKGDKGDKGDKGEPGQPGGLTDADREEFESLVPWIGTRQDYNELTSYTDRLYVIVG